MVVLKNDNSGIAAIYGVKKSKNSMDVILLLSSKFNQDQLIKPLRAYGPAIEHLNWGSDHYKMIVKSKDTNSKLG